MSVTERLMGTGRWNLTFKPDTPLSILAACDVKRYGFGHFVVTPTRVNLDETIDFDRLKHARYIGVLRERSSTHEFSGPGLAMWLGDEDGKGTILEQNDYGTTLANWRTLLTPSGFTGTGATMAGPFTRDVIRETAIEVLPDVCTFFGVEWKVYFGDLGFTLAIDTTANLFRTTPVAMILRETPTQMRDFDVLGVGAEFNVEQDLSDWTQEVRYYYGDQAVPSLTVASLGGEQAKDVPYRNVNGLAITMSRVIEDFGTSNAGASMAPAHFGRFHRVREQVTAASTEYNITKEVRCGDFVWIFDPERDLVSSVNEVYFRGQLYHPLKIRVTGHTWPLRNGMGVYLRRWIDNDTTTWGHDWVDLSDWVQWEDSTAETVELGDLPRSPTQRVRTKTVKQTIRYTTPTLTE